MVASLVGLSSSYFAALGLGVYDSVKAARELGFGLVELGAAHSFERGLWDTIRRIKRDFPDLHFTVHGLFPPMRGRFWFNASLGLTPKNKRVIGGLFRAAVIVEALVVGIHPGFATEFRWGKSVNGMNLGIPTGKIKRAAAIRGLREVIGYALGLSEDIGAKFAIENIGGIGLLRSQEDFLAVLGEFPQLGMLLDWGHALAAESGAELLGLADRFCEVHLHHYSKNAVLPDGHLPFASAKQLAFLGEIPQAKKIPLVFEHGNSVSRQEILLEKGLVEEFLRK
jgi:sugar phosphate isomerase/epimerase